MSSTDFPTLEEKRQLLELVRVKFGFETTVPRETAIDKVVEKAMAGSSATTPYSVGEIVERLAGRQLPLRFAEVQKAVARLMGLGRAQTVKLDKRVSYFLSPEASADIEREISEARARIDRVVTRLYKGLNVDFTKLRRFLLKFLSEVFARFGRQWVGVRLGHKPIEEVIGRSDVPKALETAADHAGLRSKDRKVVYDRTLQLFKQRDPDYDMLTFVLGQSYFMSHLLALDKPFDDLSAELFSGGTLYLDTNVVIVGLLPGAERFRGFQEAVAICRRLGIDLIVLEPTYRETQGVVAYEQKEVAPLYDQVPSPLVEKTRGQFYQSYVALKKENPSFTVDDVFRPFADLRRTLKEKYSIDVVDDPAFDKLAEGPEFKKAKEILLEMSLSIRNRRKADAALTHDATVLRYINSQRERNDKKHLLTLDRSLPSASLKLFERKSSLAIRLDGFLQSISPFISVDRELDFATVFAQIIEAQILPQDQVYDIRDYLVFHDIGMSCQAMPAEEVDDALHMLKTKVLRGDHYTRDTFEKAAYEIRKFFTQDYLKKQGLLAEKERESAALQQAHEREMEALRGESSQKIKLAEARFDAQLAKSRTEINALQASLAILGGQIEEGRLRRLRILRRAKCAAIFLWLGAGFCGVTWFVLKYGEGQNWFQRIKDVWSMYIAGLLLVVAVGEILTRWLLPEYTILRKFLRFLRGKDS